MKLVITCEHATAFVPEKFSALFKDEPEVLKTHEAFDPGTFDLFNSLRPVADFYKYQKISRLLVETNRSLGHASLYSRFSKVLSKEDKLELKKTWYDDFRNAVEEKIASFIKNGEEVVHFSIHSFTPVLREQVRNCDIGLLYDPKRKREKELGKYLKRSINRRIPEYKVRFNYPYKGASDGFTTYLRCVFGTSYLGIELEINQKYVQEESFPENIKQTFYDLLSELKTKKAS